MRPLPCLARAAAVGAALALWSVPPAAAQTDPLPRLTLEVTPPAAPLPPGEVRRLREHFLRVEARMAAEDVSALTLGRRENRRRALLNLARYRERGVLPRNDSRPDRATPLFRDRRGTLCALAFLIAESGEVAFVDRVAATQNDIYVDEMAVDPRFAAELSGWLDRNGITRDEAASIQPAYGWLDGPRETGINRNYVAASVLFGAVNVWTMASGERRRATTSTRNRNGSLALASGTVTSLLGLGVALSTSESGRTRSLAGANMLFGLGTMAVGLHTLLRRPHRAPKEATPPAAVSAAPPAPGPVYARL